MKEEEKLLVAENRLKIFPLLKPQIKKDLFPLIFINVPQIRVADTLKVSTGYISQMMNPITQEMFISKGRKN